MNKIIAVVLIILGVGTAAAAITDNPLMALRVSIAGLGFLAVIMGIYIFRIKEPS